MMLQRKPLVLAVMSAAVGSATGHAAELEEIVVTATKRAEPMQDIPVSIQALPERALRELGIANFGDYSQYLPNLVYSGRGPGQAEMYIRGAASEQSSLTVSSVQGSAPAVALYQDEQPVSFGGRNLDIYSTDLERIEILPGPQGTLFGSSSQSGTVRLITSKPDFAAVYGGADAKMSWTQDGEPSNAVEVFLNLPFGNRFAMRMAAFNDQAGGWIDNEQGSYAADIEVMNRNQISPSAHICTGRSEVDDPIAGEGVCTGRAVTATAENSHLAEDDFNDAAYSGARISAKYLFADDWDLLVQHTRQSLRTEGVFEYDPVLGGEESVNRFIPPGNQDEFGLTNWTLSGRFAQLDMVYTGGFLDREVYHTHDYTGYTNGGGYQAYYICSGGYSSADQCFDPAKQYLENTSSERGTHEFRLSSNPEWRWGFTAGIFIDDQETVSDGQFQYFGAREAGFNTASAPGTVTNPPLAPPSQGNIVSTVDGVASPYGRGAASIFVNSFTRNEKQLALFGEFRYKITDFLSFSLGARNYDLDYEFTGSTGSSFGCKDSAAPCDGQDFDNRVSLRLEALGAFQSSGRTSDLTAFFSESDAALIAGGRESGSFFLKGLGRNGVANQSDTIFRGTLNWHITPDMMLFGAWSEGFRPQTVNRNAGSPSGNQTGVYQGYLVPALARTDKLENLELGFKGSFLQNSLRVNATAYSSEISDLQVSRFDPANVAFLVFIENAGDAEVRGLDADFLWQVTNGLSLSGGIALVRNQLTRINPQLQDIVVDRGSRLPWTPELRFNFRARYDFPMPGLGGNAYISGSLVFTGDSLAESTCDAYFVEDSTRQIYGRGSGLTIKNEGGFCGTPLTGDDLASVTDMSFVGLDARGDTRFRAGRYVQKEYTLINLAAGLEKDEWSLEFFINNLTDERAELNVHASDFTPSVSTNRPMTAGARISFQFGN